MTGDCWEDYDVQKQFAAHVTQKKAAKEEAYTDSCFSWVSLSLKIRILFCILIAVDGLLSVC